MTTMVVMGKAQRTYVPAAGRDLFLPLYDLIAKLFGADGARQTLFDLAPLLPGDRVLDIGCGTGTFTTMLKQRYPGVEVTGLDPDPKALARARHKAEQAGVSVRFDQGFADSLQYPAASFDVVFSSFMGNKIICYYDGSKKIEATDETFKDAGKIGLWTKADSVTHFDDLKVTAR